MSNTYFENMELFDRITSEISHYEQSEMSVAELIDSLRKIIGIKPTTTEAEIRAKAIEEFIKRLYKIGEYREFDWEDIYRLADEMKAEQLKGE